MFTSNMAQLLELLKKSVVFLGRPDKDGRPIFVATGVLLSFEGLTNLVTAKHVVIDSKTGERKDGGLHAFYNSKNGQGTGRSIQAVKSFFKVDWIVDDNPEIDVAIIPYGIDPATDDLLTVPNTIFVDRKRLFQLYEIFQLSYQPGIPDEGRVSPIIRTGTISKLNGDGTLYIDSAAFPGNSGSPVFLTPSLMRFEETPTPGRDALAGGFVGIVGEYVPYQEVAVSVQTGRPRVVFEENTGLSKVWPPSFVEGITRTKAFVEQIDRIKAMQKTSEEAAKKDNAD